MNESPAKDSKTMGVMRISFSNIVWFDVYLSSCCNILRFTLKVEASACKSSKDKKIHKIFTNPDSFRKKLHVSCNSH